MGSSSRFSTGADTRRARPRRPGADRRKSRRWSPGADSFDPRTATSASAYRMALRCWFAADVPQEPQLTDLELARRIAFVVGEGMKQQQEQQQASARQHNA